MEEEKEYLIMDSTCGDLSVKVFETRKEAEEWIKQQKGEEGRYEIIERD